VVAIFATRLLGGEAPRINGDGLQTRDYVHVSDVVAANLACLGRPGFHTYNVGTGVETTVVEIYEGLRTAIGSELLATHGPASPGEQRRSSIDASRIGRELGAAPRTSLQEGLRRTADWFRDQRT
jgi:UDP-glucose 4-epimerase